MCRARTHKKPCRICRRWFLPEARLKDRQKTCGRGDDKAAPCLHAGILIVDAINLPDPATGVGKHGKRHTTVHHPLLLNIQPDVGLPAAMGADGVAFGFPLGFRHYHGQLHRQGVQEAQVMGRSDVGAGGIGNGDGELHRAAAGNHAAGVNGLGDPHRRFNDGHVGLGGGQALLLAQAIGVVEAGAVGQHRALVQVDVGRDGHVDVLVGPPVPVAQRVDGKDQRVADGVVAVIGDRGRGEDW